MEITTKTVKAIIKQYSGQEQMLAIPRPFIKFTGDHIAALVLSQIVYWSDKGDDPEGWFYKTADEWEAEICISYAQLKRATDSLEKLGIEKSVRKVNGTPKLHFRVNESVFYPALVEFLQIEESRNSRKSKVEKVESQKTSTSDIQETQISEIQETRKSFIDTKNTTEITPTITSEANASTAKAKPKRKGAEVAKATADPRTKHPAIQACRSIASQYPPLEVYDEIIAAIGAEPDIDRLTDCRKTYVLAGKNRNGWTWVTDWYVNGIPEWYQKKGATDGQSKKQPTANGMGPRASIVANRNYRKWDNG